VTAITHASNRVGFYSLVGIYGIPALPAPDGQCCHRCIRDADTVNHTLFECQYWSSLGEDLGLAWVTLRPRWTCRPFCAAQPSRTTQWGPRCSTTRKRRSGSSTRWWRRSWFSKKTEIGRVTRSCHRHHQRSITKNNHFYFAYLFCCLSVRLYLFFIL